MAERKQLNEALIETAKAGNLGEVRRLIEQGADPNHGEIPSFLFAYFSGHRDVVQYLLAHGGDVKYDAFSEGTILHATGFNDDPDSIPYLLEAGADVNHAMPHGGETPLHHAADMSRTAAAKALLKHGADVNRRAGTGPSELNYGAFAGDTPLHVAAVRGQTDFIRLLLDAGAGRTATNGNGLTPLALAEQKGRDEEILALLR